MDKAVKHLQNVVPLSQQGSGEHLGKKITHFHQQIDKNLLMKVCITTLKKMSVLLQVYSKENRSCTCRMEASGCHGYIFKMTLFLTKQ